MFDGSKISGGCEKIVDCGRTIPVYIKSGWGIALNLGQDSTLGSSVGNRVEDYDGLEFWLASEQGEYIFSNGINNQLKLCWNGDNLNLYGKLDTPYKIKRI